MSTLGSLPVVSLFSGALGLDLGLERAGLSLAIAVESNGQAAATIALNRPEVPLFAKKVGEVSTKELLNRAKLEAGGDFVVSGGPSCQAFSTAGQRGSLDDPRGGLFRDFVRVVREARPRFFVMENVRGLLSAAVKHRPLKERGPGFPPLAPEEELGSALMVVAGELRSLGYHVLFDVLDAADYGVPQHRERLVFIGSRDGEPIRFPAPTHGAGLMPYATLEDALSAVGEYDDDYYEFSPAKRRFLALLGAGANWRSLPAELRAEALGRAHASWGGRSGFYRRLAPGRPSPTLNTRPDSKATSLCHPYELRPLTVGEYARIQQFPSGWRFAGSVREKYRQAGNAVPVGLGEAIGRALVESATTSTRLPDRLGRVACENLQLLARLSRRPSTVHNPPRMRGGAGGRAELAEWRGDRPALRSDHLMYAPPERLDELRRLIGTAKGARAGAQEEPALPLAAE